MTTDELNTIVAAVVAELEKSGVDFDYKAEQAKDDDLVFVIRGTAPDYQGVTVTWKGLLDIITSQAIQAKTDAETAKNAANAILTQVTTKESNVSTMKSEVSEMKASVETTKSQVEGMKNAVETTKGQVETMKTSIETTKEEVETMKTSVETSKSQVEADKGQVETMKTSIETTKGEVETLKSESETAKETATQKAAETTQAKGDVESMKASVEKTVADFNALAEEKKLEVQGVYQNDLNELKGDLSDIDALEKERKIPFISAYSKSTSTTNYIAVVIPSSLLENNKPISFDIYCEDDVRPYLMIYDCDMTLDGNDRAVKRIGNPTYTDTKDGNWYHYSKDRFTLTSLPSKDKVALIFNIVPNDSVKRIIEGYICNIKLNNHICDTKIEDVFLYSVSPTAEDKVNLYNVGLIEYISNIKKINEFEKDIFYFKKIGNGKILCIGDSLTAGIYSNETKPRNENYPYFMKRIISNESINAGFPGYSASMIWNENKLQSVDFTDVKHIIIMLGTNGGLTDTLETDVYAYDDYHDYATTKTGCYCKIIEYCMEQAPTAHIYLCTTPFFDKIRKPNYAPPITPDANIVIPKIAEFYGLRVFDVRNGLGVNSKNTNTIQPDGLHGQKEFYERLGTFIGSQLIANASWVE